MNRARESQDARGATPPRHSAARVDAGRWSTEAIKIHRELTG